MRKWDIAVLLLVTVVAVVVGVHQVMLRLAQQGRDATVASLETPAPIRFYEELNADTADTVSSFETEATPDVPTASGPCGSRKAIVAAWIGLFEEAAQWNDTELRTFDFDSSEETPFDTLGEEVKTMEDYFERVRALAPCGGPLYPLQFPEFHLEGSPYEEGRNDVLKLLLGGVFVAAHQDDAPKAIANFIAILQIADALALEPALLSQSTRYRVYDQVREAYLKCYGDAVLPPDLLARLSAHLAQAHHREGLYNGVAAQPRYTVAFFASWHAETFAEAAAGRGYQGATQSAIWNSPLCEPLFLEDERSAVEYWKRIAAVPNAPFYEIQPDLERIESEIDAIPIVKCYSKIIIPQIIAGTFPVQARHEIGVDLWRLKLLAERYRADTGALPALLEEAASHFGEALPIDPGNGEYYRYAFDEDCYELSSTGMELLGGENFSYTLCPE